MEISGRPEDGEFAAYARADIERVAGEDAVAALIEQEHATLTLLARLDDAAVGGIAYAPGKWTFKDVLAHLADDERIYAYRALCLARGDSKELPGFDENLYARNARGEERPWKDLLGDYRAVRKASITLFRGLTPGAWRRRGIVNGHAATVRGLAFHIAGHELRHVAAIREKYLPLVR